MSLHYLLDGYNILYQIPEFQDKELEDQRQSLINRIDARKPQGSNEVTIYFDGRPGRVRPQETAHVKAIFTQAESADEQIKRKVSHSLNSKQFVVVTNDREIQYAVRAEGATILKVEEFWKRCKARPTKKTNSPRKISDSDERAITDEFKNIWLKKDQEE